MQLLPIASQQLYYVTINADKIVYGSDFLKNRNCGRFAITDATMHLSYTRFY